MDLRIVKGRRFEVARSDYEPTVTIVVPLYNEGQSSWETRGHGNVVALAPETKS